VRTHACYHYDAAIEEPRRAVTFACPRRPLRAQPRRETVAATAPIKWPGPLPNKDDPRAARALGSKNLTLEGCDYRPVASKPVQRERAPQVPSIYKKLLISGSRAGTAKNPRNPQMRKDGGTQLPPRTALLIKGSKPDPRRIRTGAPDHQSQGR
jgi:hypothetical protein